MLEYVLVFLAALLVGAVVYGLSVRQGSGAPAVGVEPPPPPASAPTPPTGATYLPVVPTTTTWEHRVTGVVGILVTVILTGALLAFVLYLGGSIVYDAISKAATNGGVGGGPPV